MASGSRSRPDTVPPVRPADAFRALTESFSPKRAPKPRKVPRGTFLLGAFVGTALTLPGVAAALALVASRWRLGDPPAELDRIAVHALIFAGLPTLLAAGGVARLAAHRTAERWDAGASRKGKPARRHAAHALFPAMAAMAIVGAGAAVLTIVPMGGLPEHTRDWWPIPTAGLVAGLVAGAALGALVGLRQARFAAWRQGASAAAPPPAAPTPEPAPELAPVDVIAETEAHRTAHKQRSHRRRARKTDKPDNTD